MTNPDQGTNTNNTPIPPSLGSNPEPEKPEEKGNGQAHQDNLYREIARQEAQMLTMKKELEQMREENKSLKGLEDRLRNEGPGMLEQYGWDMNTISSRILNENQPTVEEEIKRVRDEIKTIQEEQAEKDKQTKTEARQRFLQDYTKEFKEFIDQNEDYGPLRTLFDIWKVSLGKDPDLSMELAPIIDAQYKEHGVIYQPSKMAEEWLDTAKQRIDQIKANEALKKMFGVPSDSDPHIPAGSPMPTTTPEHKPMTSLSNEVDSSRSSPVDSTKMSHDDRLRFLTSRLEELSRARDTK